MTLKDVMEILDREGIEYEYCEENEYFRERLYVQNAVYGEKYRKKGDKKFRPDFRITVHEENPTRVYIKNCGWTEYRKIEDVVEYLKRGGIGA